MFLSSLLDGASSNAIYNRWASLRNGDRNRTVDNSLRRLRTAGKIVYGKMTKKWRTVA